MIVFDFIKKWRFGIACILGILVIAYVVNDLGNQQEATNQLVRANLVEDLDDEYDTCLNRVDLRKTMYGLLDAVVEGSVPIGVALDLIRVQGYAELDPATQGYLANLDAVFDSGNEEPSTIARIRDDYKSNNPIPDCDAELRVNQAELEEDLKDGS